MAPNLDKQSLTREQAMRKPEFKAGQLYALVLQDYIDNEQKSLATVAIHIKKHLREAFPDDRSAARITTRDLEQYKTLRRAEGASQSSVNSELAALRRGYNLAVEKDLLDRRYMPKFNLYKIGNKNRKQGFFERHEFEKILAHTRPYQQLCYRFGYIVGWRQGELFDMTWEKNYNAEHQEIRIYDSKNGEGRVLPLVDQQGRLNDLGVVIEDCKTLRHSTAPWIFHYEGRQLNKSTFCKHQREARKLSGIDKTFHDFRRTASRNLRNKGVDQVERMAIIGHKTTSMDLRYSIVNKADMQRALSAVSTKKPKGGDDKPSDIQAPAEAQNSAIKLNGVAERAGFEPASDVTPDLDFETRPVNNPEFQLVNLTNSDDPTASRASYTAQVSKTVKLFLNLFTKRSKNARS